MIEYTYEIHVLLFIFFVICLCIKFKFSKESKQLNNMEHFLKYMKQNNNSSLSELDLMSDFIKRHPKNLFAISERALYYTKKGFYDDAISDYNYLIKKDPKKFDYVRDCAKVYAYLSDFNTAFDLINNFYISKNKDAEYFAALASIFMIKKDYHLSLKNYNQAINLDTYSEYLYKERAQVYLEMGENDKYKKDMKVYNKLYNMPADEREKIEMNTLLPVKFQFKLSILKIVFIFVVAILLSFLYPTKEIMQCGPQKICIVEKRYLAGYMTHKEIKLLPSSNISCKIKPYHLGKSYNDYGLYLKLDGVSPFSFYVADAHLRKYVTNSDLNKQCSFYKSGFNQYINNNGQYSQFTIKSQANIGNFLYKFITTFGIFIIFIFILCRLK